MKNSNFMKKIFLILFATFLFINFDLSAQIKEFDRLEMLYSQGHYNLVYKKANRILDNPEFDYSQLPKLYKSMAIIQLCQNEQYYKKHPDYLEEAKDLFLGVKKSNDGMKIFNAHIYEVSALKKDVSSWLEDLKRKNDKKTFELVQNTLRSLFENVPDIEDKKPSIPINIEIESDLSESASIRSQREAIINLAKIQVGVPYLWAGNEPSGFDCSGFTSYVMKNNNKTIPRRAVEQYEASKKIKQKNVQQGDLVFFDSGSGINHVGIIVSGKGEPLIMIHASSSKGITITEIEKTDYWVKRLYGFGTFIE
jgi:cell wall-associated NlpC family hydrolase